jgi:hypothetical protein
MPNVIGETRMYSELFVASLGSSFATGSKGSFLPSPLLGQNNVEEALTSPFTKPLTDSLPRSGTVRAPHLAIRQLHSSLLATAARLKTSSDK